MNYPTLSAFLAGYLHQDWDAEYDDAFQAARDYVRSESAATVRVTTNELDQLVTSELADESLKQWLLDVGCYFLPIGSAREWLTALRDALADDVDPKE